MGESELAKILKNEGFEKGQEECGIKTSTPINIKYLGFLALIEKYSKEGKRIIIDYQESSDPKNSKAKFYVK